MTEAQEMEREVGRKLIAGGLMERGASFKFDPNRSFRKQRRRAQDATDISFGLGEEAPPQDGAPRSMASPSTASFARSPAARSGSARGLVRAKTSIGFSEGREQGRLPARLAYIQRVTHGAGSGGPSLDTSYAGSGLPDIQRPPAYQELADLLRDVSETMSLSTANKTWISTQAGFRGSWPRARTPPPPVRSRPSSRAHSRPSSRGDSRPSSRSGPVQPGMAAEPAKRVSMRERRAKEEEERKKLNPLKVYVLSKEAEECLPARLSTPNLIRAGSVNNVGAGDQVDMQPREKDAPGRQTLRPTKKGKKSSMDELDMLAIKSSGQDAAFPKLRREDTVDISGIGGAHVDAPSAGKGRGLQRSTHHIDPVEVALPADSPEVRKMLGRYARGDARKVVPKVRLLPQVKNPVWNEEKRRLRLENDAATWMQKSWRRYIRRKKYKMYIIHKASRTLYQQKSILQVWLRAVRQRDHEHPPGSNVRGLMSYWLIAWRVEVRRQQIAIDKAKDLKSIWEAVWGKKVLRCWACCSRVLAMERKNKLWYGYEPWKSLWNDSNIVKRSFSKHTKMFMFAVFRCIYFYARCASKTRLRAARLFRLEEESIYELVMPTERFPGWYQFFHTEPILEHFRAKDWRGRRVFRMNYQRLLPFIFEKWQWAREEGNRWRVAVCAHETTLKNNAFSALCFLLELDDLGNRVHRDVDLEMEDEAREQFEKEKAIQNHVDPMKQIEANIDNLAGLVDYENQALLRSLVRDAKHKTMYRIKIDSLDKEREVLAELSEKIARDNEVVEKLAEVSSANEHLKREEEVHIMADIHFVEETKWSQSIQQVRDLFTRATDILGRVLEMSSAERDAKVFRLCWQTLRKAAFKVRIRRLFNRAHIRRLIRICVFHLRLKRSIYKYYPLRLCLYALLRWFKFVENRYLHTTPGLKGAVRRRQDLYLKLGVRLEEFSSYLVFARVPDMVEYTTLPFVIRRWIELTQTSAARRAILDLFHKRQGLRLLARCFDFLKHGVRWRERTDASVKLLPSFLEKQAACDLEIWKKNYFSGTSYAQKLRLSHRRGKVKALALVSKGPRLVAMMQQRRTLVESRLKLEQQLLMRYFEAVDSAAGDCDAPQGLASSPEAFPVTSWGSVLNMRRNNTLQLLQRCDVLARAAQVEFDSINIGMSLSNSFFKIRCNKLPEVTAKKLPSSKRYWRHIKGLFALANHAIAVQEGRS